MRGFGKIAVSLLAAFLLAATAQAGSPGPAKAPVKAPAAAPEQSTKKLPDRTPFTADNDEAAAIPGIPGARFWADSEAGLKDSVPNKGPWLVLSGGGADGAFGAGLLVGLTDAKQRPDYAVVTGASTGALMAVYAFLGPAHDAELKEAFTGITAAEVFELGKTEESLLDTWPLKALIEKRVTPELMQQVATEHRRGRRLFVLTSNVDSQRSVVWNMGAIAAHGGEDALKLFRAVLLATSSIPGLFPPVLIPVEADGKQFAEMHVDGTVGAPLYVGPESLLSNARGGGLLASLFTPKAARLPASDITIIVNGKLTPDFTVTERNTLAVLGRSVTMGLKMATRSTVSRIYAAAKQQSVGFKLAYVGDDVDIPSHGLFDQKYMTALFDYGVQRGRSKSPFASDPAVAEQRDKAATTASGPAND